MADRAPPQWRNPPGLPKPGPPEHALTVEQRARIARDHGLPAEVVSELSRDLAHALIEGTMLNARERSDRARAKALSELAARAFRHYREAQQIQKTAVALGIAWHKGADASAINAAREMFRAVMRERRGLPRAMKASKRGRPPDHVLHGVVAACCRAFEADHRRVSLSRALSDGEPRGPLIRLIDDVSRLIMMSGDPPAAETVTSLVKDYRAAIPGGGKDAPVARGRMPAWRGGWRRRPPASQTGENPPLDFSVFTILTRLD